MLTNREVKKQCQHLAGCLDGYVKAIDRLPPEKLDELPVLYEPWYCGLVKEFGKFLMMLGDVDPSPPGEKVEE